ncbi:hypothetical protein NQZ79_g2969 [Umbelopsis isabellina]|nr:hypothetical protein NQZ79_g2969 [Umbelopsis isabellina]
MTVEEDGKLEPQYKSFNPYKLEAEQDSQRETVLPVSQAITSRTIGSLKQNGKSFGRLQSVNDHHKTTLGGVKKMKFKPTVPATRRVIASQAPPKSEVSIKREDEGVEISHQPARHVTRTRRQDIITANLTATGPFSLGPNLAYTGSGTSDRSKRERSKESFHIGKFWPFDDRLTVSTSMNMYEGMELPISLKSRNEAFVGDEPSMSANASAEEGNRTLGDGLLTDNNSLANLRTINNGDLFLIQMPTLLPSFRPAGDDTAIQAMQETIKIEEENILEITESSTVMGSKNKQKETAVSKKVEKSKLKVKTNIRKKGKENRTTKMIAEESTITYKSSSNKDAIAANEERDRETVKSRSENRPGIDLAHLPDGQIGTLQVYKSGKVKLKIGDILMDLDTGMLAGFLQDLVIVETGNKPHVCQLGAIKSKFVATPDLSDLLKSD